MTKYTTKRKPPSLLINALEEFLLPPKGGLDWRVPGFMVEEVKKFGHHSYNWTEIEMLAKANESIVFVIIKFAFLPTVMLPNESCNSNA